MNKILKPALLLISAIALFIANTSTMACLVWTFREPKMPKSLIK